MVKLAAPKRGARETLAQNSVKSDNCKMIMSPPFFVLSADQGEGRERRKNESIILSSNVSLQNMMVVHSKKTQEIKSSALLQMAEPTIHNGVPQYWQSYNILF